MTQTRKLVDGSSVTALDQDKTLQIKTKCPEKWLMVDLETGTAWEPTGNHFSSASTQKLKALKLVVEALHARPDRQ